MRPLGAAHNVTVKTQVHAPPPPRGNDRQKGNIILAGDDDNGGHVAVTFFL